MGLEWHIQCLGFIFNLWYYEILDENTRFHSILIVLIEQ